MEVIEKLCTEGVFIVLVEESDLVDRRLLKEVSYWLSADTHKINIANTKELCLNIWDILTLQQLNFKGKLGS